MKTRILIVEDEVLIANDLAKTLQGMDYTVTAIAYDGNTALKEISSNAPDLVLLDINLGSQPDGIRIAEQLQHIHRIPFIFLTSYATEMILDKAKKTQPVGYVVKPFTEKDLLAAIKIGLHNYDKIKPVVKFDFTNINKRLPSPLSLREFELISDLYDGMTNQQLAEKYFISINTVKTHIRHIFDKLGVQSRTEAIVLLRNILVV